VIIPVAKGDETWRNLLPDLVALDFVDEIIFVSPKSKEADLASEVARVGLARSCQWMTSEEGRAKQFNWGVKNSLNSVLWFLHCDSRVSNAGIRKLKRMSAMNPKHILFFDLDFLMDGPRMIFINKIGAWIRSRILRLPFGDQGFCMSREVFLSLGGFDEKASYGEDHLLIWKAHQSGVPMKCIGGGLKTSARKYANQGWIKTTFWHVTLTIRQALPELKLWLRDRRPS